MLDPKSLLNLVIRPTLNLLALGGEKAEALVLGTGLVESQLNTIAQVHGPALSPWQIEPATEADIWNNYLRYHMALRDVVGRLRGAWPDQCLPGNLYYASAICRIKYNRVPEQLPDLDVVAMANYWKRYYNTEKGAGTPEHFVSIAGPTLQQLFGAS